MNGVDCVRPRCDFGVPVSSNDSSNMNNTKNQRVSDDVSPCALTDLITMAYFACTVRVCVVNVVYVVNILQFDLNASV